MKVILIFLLFFSALISGSEVAFFSLSQEQIEKCRKSQSRVKQKLGRLLFNPKRLLAKPTALGNLEWRESLRTTAVVLSDRQLATGNTSSRSIWSSINGHWQGSVIFNDNHVDFALTDKGYDGQYGKTGGKLGTGTINNLFDLNGGDGRMTSD